MFDFIRNLLDHADELLHFESRFLVDFRVIARSCRLVLPADPVLFNFFDAFVFVKIFLALGDVLIQLLLDQRLEGCVGRSLKRDYRVPASRLDAV